MLAIILSWIIISVIFLSFGDFLVSIYNQFCKKECDYSIIDRLLLGMCLTVIILSISSLWLPVNQYILAASLVFSIGYWVVRKNRLRALLHSVKSLFNSLSCTERILIGLSVSALIGVSLWAPGVFDAFFYHQQHIRWNEEFATVPGLANLEDRFGFNSNYFLLCALFSFRFLFGEAIYTMQPLMVGYVLCWIMIEVVRSNYNVKRLLLLSIFTLLFLLFAYTILTTTSTDIIPSLISFYIIARFILYPNWIKKYALLATLIPVMLITFKVSIIPLCLISLYALVLFIKQKEYRSVIFICIASLLIIIPWLIRNVIISGYLIYPFQELDFFSFDWEIPAYVAAEQRHFIEKCGIGIKNDFISSFGKDFSIHYLISFVIYGLALISPLIVAYNALRKKLTTEFLVVYTSLAITIALWLINAPDPRFIAGILLIAAYIGIVLLLPNKLDISFSKKGILSFAVLAIFLIAWAGKRTQNYYGTLNLKSPINNAHSLSSVLIKPYSFKEQMRAQGADVDDYDQIRLNNGHVIYLGKTQVGGRPVAFDKFPATIEPIGSTSKFQHVNTIEGRGASLADGFRAKE